MKDLGKPKYCSLLQHQHLHSYIMVYYVVYIQNILEKFIVDKSYPSITLMVVHSLEVEKDLFRPRDDENKILELNVPLCHWIHQTQCIVQETTLINRD